MSKEEGPKAPLKHRQLELTNFFKAVPPLANEQRKEKQLAESQWSQAVITGLLAPAEMCAILENIFFRGAG